VLAIETSTIRGEIALGDERQVLAAAVLPEDRKHTATLVPAIGDLCLQVGWSPADFNLVCVDIGPGSYTGLRVGLTCAKTLAFAAGAELVPVPSLDVVAENAPAGETELEVAFDAARGQVFAARYARDLGAPWRPHRAVQIEDANDWSNRLSRVALVLGPALQRYAGLLTARIRMASEDRWMPQAKAVWKLGVEMHSRQPAVDYWTLEPVYLRPSAAEEKLPHRNDGVV
jgi:tRNA threonylcarbamoyladenosine biosynthesis protein TsaB